MEYDKATETIRAIAQENAASQRVESIEIYNAVNRVAASEVRSTRCTPPYATSAMDGYAISSQDVSTASSEEPVKMIVVGSILAGDDDSTMKEVYHHREYQGTTIAVEIMTGAKFPGGLFDCVVPVERTRVLDETHHGMTVILVVQAMRSGQHVRGAGEDFTTGDMLLAQNEVVTEQHVMGLAAAGIDKVLVKRRPTIGIWSTGAELISTRTCISDVNGPYLRAVCQARGLDVTFLGVLNDDLAEISTSILQVVSSNHFDVLITSGAVSVGKADFIRAALDMIEARVIFHGVKMRPGHPALFALLPQRLNESMNGHSLQNGNRVMNGHRPQIDTPLFGLPGNPLAAAAGFEFLVMPYLEQFGVRRPFSNRRARLKTSRKLTHKCDEFRHGFLMRNGQFWICRLSDDQSPAKVRPFHQADCWIHLRAGQTNQDLVDCLPLRHPLNEGP